MANDLKIESDTPSSRTEDSGGEELVIPKDQQSSYRLFAFAVCLSVAIFFLDMSLPLGIAGGIPYIVAVMIGIWLPNQGQILIITIITIALVILGYFLSPSGGVLWIVLVNRAMAIFAIVAVGSVIYWTHGTIKRYSGVDNSARGFFGILGLGAMSLGFISLLSVFALTFFANREATTSQEWITHTREVETHISHALSLMQDLETGQRGFLLTGNDSYLEPFNAAVNEVDTEIEGLRELTQDNPSQQERLDDLLPLVNEKILELRRTISLRQTEGLASALEVVKTDIGKQIMDNIRNILESMGNEEELLLIERELLYKKFRYYALAGYGFALALFIGISIIIANRIRNFIAQREESEKILTAATDRLSSSQEIAHVGSWDWNILSGDLAWTDEIYNVFGRSREDFGATYENFLECIHPDDRDKVASAVGGAVEKDAPYGIEHRVVRPDGSVRFVHEMGKVYRDDDGNPTRMLGVVHDITERTLLDKSKSEFISTVSHELRTPLTSIKGSLGLIKSGAIGDLPDKIQSMLDIAYNNSERLVLLINDILDIEKIEAGKMNFIIKPMSIALLIKEVLKANKGYGDEHGITFVCPNCDEDILVNGDSNRLMQVLSNLMSNAAKFSPDGGKVELSVIREGGSIRINVKDYGPGIPEAFRESIFKKFTQADASDTRQKGGTGLGLSITKAIVEQHDGTIGFETEVGKGTTFFIDLPKLAQQHEALSSRSSKNGQHLILICEDEVDIATLLEMMLGNAGYLTNTARTAAQAKQLLEEGDYDAMTLDLGLPDQDGISLLQELRESPKTRNLPIIVVSATAGESQQRLNGDAIGVIDWIEKPIDSELLIDRLGRAIRGHSVTRPRILHVEDDESIITIVSALVEETADIIAAKTVNEAKGLLKQETFDLVILDLMLPDGNGEDLLPLLSKPGQPSIPVIIFSVKDVSHEIAESIMAVLVKSQTSNVELLNTIRSAIESKQAVG